MNPKRTKWNLLLIFFALLTTLAFLPGSAFAKYQYEFIPSVSFSEQYDDNINLNDKNKKSDYITSVSPSAELWLRSEKNNLSLRYTPSFVRYAEQSQNDTIRHSGSVSYFQELSEHIQFNLSDTFRRSEDPIEETEDVQEIRKTRNTYTRNSGQVRLSYKFGPESALTAGYSHSLLENEDVAIDDSVSQNPYAELIWWFNVQNGMTLSYRYTRADFWRDDDSISGDDYQGHATSIKYMRRFAPHTIGSVGYDYSTRQFEGNSEDYDIHEGSIGIEHAFSEALTLSARTGYFVQKKERSTEDETGLSYNLSLSKRFKRGNWSIGGRGGWNESYQEAERRGFTRFWSAQTNIQYQILEPLSGYGAASYREDTEEPNRDWTTLRANLGLKWAFWKYFALSLDYSRANRDDDVDIEDYTVNRVMLVLSARRLFKW